MNTGWSAGDEAGLRVSATSPLSDTLSLIHFMWSASADIVIRLHQGPSSNDQTAAGGLRPALKPLNVRVAAQAFTLLSAR